VTEHLFPDATDLEAALLSSEITSKEINYCETNSISKNNDMQNMGSLGCVAEDKLLLECDTQQYGIMHDFRLLLNVNEINTLLGCYVALTGS